MIMRPNSRLRTKLKLQVIRKLTSIDTADGYKTIVKADLLSDGTIRVKKTVRKKLPKLYFSRLSDPEKW